MNRTRWTSLLSLVLILALSTACLTLFPESPEGPPTEERDERGPLKFDPPSLPNARVGVPYEVQIEVTQNVTRVGDFMVEPETLPPGLELTIVENVHDTARITGTPEKAGTYTFRIDVWCYGTMVSGQMGSKEYTIVVE
jgi:hypothetical protein